MRSRCLAACAAVFLLCRPAAANRPLQTEDAYVAERHHFELEASWDHLAFAGGAEQDVMLLVTNYGAAKRLELSLETPLLWTRPASGPSAAGFSDVSVVTKLQLASESEKTPAFLLRTFAKLSNAGSESGLGTGSNSYAMAAVASKDLGPVVLHAQLGYFLAAPRSPSRVDGGHFFGAAADAGLTKRVRAVAEINGGRRSERDGLADPVSVFGGAVLRLSESTAFDAGVRRGLSVSAPRWQTTLGFFRSF